VLEFNRRGLDAADIHMHDGWLLKIILKQGTLTFYRFIGGTW
jgi:hypothetical protein